MSHCVCFKSITVKQIDLIHGFPVMTHCISKELNKFCVLTTTPYRARVIHFYPPLRPAAVRSSVAVLLLLGVHYNPSVGPLAVCENAHYS